MTDAAQLQDLARAFQNALSTTPYPKHHAIQAVAKAAADERQAAIVAWLRGEQNQNEVINLTLAMRNSAVRATMNKCADILESGEWKGQE